VKSVRLLPVVIFAALALLLFKGIGLVTNGGYVLTGAATAEAAGGGGDHGGSVEGEAGITIPLEPTMSDSSPTLDDGAPTLPMGDKDAEHGGETAAGADHGSEAAAGNDHVADDDPAAAAHGDEVAAECPAKAGTEGEGFNFVMPEKCPVAGVNAAGDSLPTTVDASGKVVPLGNETPGSEQAVVERLGDRREALDARESELEMRLALVEAAEKRIAERTAALEVLEARIDALVKQKQVSDDSQFASIVAMYETMKPKEAAAIFNQLDMPVLLRVASAMSPRKMAPIMAKMEPQKAKDLTAGMAFEQPEPTIDLGEEDLAGLPQIVGQ
jgi:flagellar motility protein MotE (MotC chaperone)